MKAGRPDPPSTKTTNPAPSATFTGSVFMDLGHRDPTIAIQHVFFTPSARTYWHHHENGQLLKVVAGAGWVCEKGGKPKRLAIGDIVWCPPGTIHWHGADEGSYLCHLAVSHGKTSWMHEVSEDEYAAKGQ